VLRRLQRRADNRHRRQLAAYEAELEEVKHPSESTCLRLGFGWRPREPERVKVRPPPYWDRYPWLMPTCRVCRQTFVGPGRALYCSPACFRKREQPPRPSRAKPKGTAACPGCGAEFEQPRKDARFCSVRCRVAAHRAKGGNETK
jgi:hypothetical protein